MRLKDFYAWRRFRRLVEDPWAAVHLRQDHNQGIREVRFLDEDGIVHDET